MNLKGRDFLTLKDYTPEEIEYLIELAAKLKKMKKDGVVEQPLLGKNVALIFEKTSTRTRCSFEVAHLFPDILPNKPGVYRFFCEDNLKWNFY